MITVEMFTRYGALNVHGMNLRKHVEKYLEENSYSVVKDNIRRIKVVDNGNRINCKKVVLIFDEPDSRSTLGDWLAKGLRPVCCFFSEIFIIRPIDGDEEDQRADILKLDYPDREKLLLDYDVTEFKGVPGGRGYDVKEKVEKKYDVDLYWDWKKWQKFKVAEKI